MPITQDGVELTVAISEKAAGKIKYFAEKDGIHEKSPGSLVGSRACHFGESDESLPYSLESHAVMKSHGASPDSWSYRNPQRNKLNQLNQPN